MKEQNEVEIEIEGKTLRVPHEMICPLTLEIMETPLVSVHGHHFERNAIMSWLRRGDYTCPLTRQPLNLRDLVHDRQLEFKIRLWKQGHGFDVESLYGNEEVLFDDMIFYLDPKGTGDDDEDDEWNNMRHPTRRRRERRTNNVDESISPFSRIKKMLKLPLSRSRISMGLANSERNIQ